MKSFIQWTVRKFLSWKGWEFGPSPEALRTVLIVYPHTSMWDFLYGICVGISWGRPFHFIAKKSLFFFPVGSVLTWLGGIPIERGQGSKQSTSLRKTFEGKSDFFLVITPEGTRSYKDYLHSGFYHIAKAVEVPVTLAFIDYKQKQIGVSTPLSVDGPITGFMDKVREFYEGKMGLYPEKQNRICLKDEALKEASALHGAEAAKAVEKV